MKKQILFLFFLISKFTFACECPPLQPVSKDLCNSYDVIFYGKVDSVSACGISGFATVYFSINELYKGNSEQKTKINFDCISACLMSFEKNEEWIIYASYKRFDELAIKLCEHSRKHFANEKDDFYQINSHRSFEQEKQFLNTTFGIQSFIHNNELNNQQADFKPHNDQPSGMNKLLLLFISFVAMALVYYVTRNKKKNDN